MRGIRIARSGKPATADPDTKSSAKTTAFSRSRRPEVRKPVDVVGIDLPRAVETVYPRLAVHCDRHVVVAGVVQEVVSEHRQTRGRLPGTPLTDQEHSSGVSPHGSGVHLLDSARTKPPAQEMSKRRGGVPMRETRRIGDPEPRRGAVGTREDAQEVGCRLEKRLEVVGRAGVGRPGVRRVRPRLRVPRIGGEGRTRRTARRRLPDRDRQSGPCAGRRLEMAERSRQSLRQLSACKAKPNRHAGEPERILARAPVRFGCRLEAEPEVVERRRLAGALGDGPLGGLRQSRHCPRLRPCRRSRRRMATPPR
jgi:hypothetical protein